MFQIKEVLKTNSITRKPYQLLKKGKNSYIKNKCLGYKGHFDNRSLGREKMCIILAGYKSFLYDDVFSRIIKFAPSDIDICVVSSGVFSDTLSKICDENNWSYLSITENNVGLAQNVAINLHPNARYIYKLDEDIFITESYFENLFEAFNRAKISDYNPGVMAPMLLVNGFSTLLLIEKAGIRTEFEKRFGSIKHAAGPNTIIEKDSSVARFLWGEGDATPSIDELNGMVQKQEKKEIACPIRFSIGAILFERDLWEEMKYFDVKRNDPHMMGKDEIKICEYCMINSMPIMVSENIVVGHFSFGKQTEGMKDYYKNHPEKFQIAD